MGELLRPVAAKRCARDLKLRMQRKELEMEWEKRHASIPRLPNNALSKMRASALQSQANQIRVQKIKKNH